MIHSILDNISQWLASLTLGGIIVLMLGAVWLPELITWPKLWVPTRVLSWGKRLSADVKGYLYIVYTVHYVYIVFGQTDI